MSHNDLDHNNTAFYTFSSRLPMFPPQVGHLSRTFFDISPHRSQKRVADTGKVYVDSFKSVPWASTRETLGLRAPLDLFLTQSLHI